MNDSSKNYNFTNKIDQIELELEAICSEAIKELPNQPEEQAAIFLESMSKKVNKLLEEIPEENRENFQKFIKEKLNLNTKDDTDNFISSAPNKIDNLIKSHFLSSNS